MSLRQVLRECIPPAQYSNGKEAKCWLFKICNMFDVDPESYIVDNKKKDMEINETTITKVDGSTETEPLKCSCTNCSD